ncbi:MAG TPA: UbiX family flavin prenyltransferase [Firmicutes bacterium]|nr:UbiX family flavin prenyltransferase [Bacillota bacterium]
MVRLVVGITGASGAIYGIRLLEALKKYGVETYLIMTRWAEETIRIETDYAPDYVRSLAYRVLDNNDLGAPVSSGSFRTGGMIIAPCSMKTLAGIATGYTENLMVRAADVCLKERRPLLLLTRETPLNMIHLENMLKLSRAGAVIMPPVPAFYNRPQTIDDLVEHTVGRLLDSVGIANDGLFKRWGSEGGENGADPA